MTAPDATASIAIDAPAEEVYALVSDVPGMSRWTVECDGGRWLDAATGARVGARFRGHNRIGRRRWVTTGTVTAADPGRRFAFRVSSFGMPVADWAYDIAPTAAGCLVTESTWYRAGPVLRYLLAPLATGVTSRTRRTTTNERNILRTLQNLKSTAEPTIVPPTPR